jgi:hypothetical protein
MIELGALNAPSEGPLPAVGVFSLQHWQSFATTSDHPTSQSSITETVGLRTIIHDLRLFNRRPFGEGPLNWIMLDHANVCQPNTLHLILHETCMKHDLAPSCSCTGPGKSQDAFRREAADGTFDLVIPTAPRVSNEAKERRTQGISRASMCCV